VETPQLNARANTRFAVPLLSSSEDRLGLAVALELTPSTKFDQNG
jgi:hypothetical protein